SNRSQHPQKSRLMPAFLCCSHSRQMQALSTVGLSVVVFVFFFHGTVDQLHERHRGVLALSETTFEDAYITTGAIGRAWRQLGKQLADGFLVAQPGKGQAPVGYAVLPAQRDQRFGHGAQHLGPRQGCPDQLMLEQRSRHVLQHGLAMSRIATKVGTTLEMAHDDYSLSTGLLVVACQNRPRWRPQALFSVSTRSAGGQLSTVMPSARSCSARTVLISVRDFLPRFGVRINSCSVR